MLHRVELPQEVCRPLSRVVLIQMATLRYAASVSTATKAECALYLTRLPALRSESNAIANWIWRAETRWRPLELFASHQNADDKGEWARVRSREALTMLRRRRPTTLTPLLDDAASWEKAAALFLQEFYEVLGTNTGFPASILGDSHIGSYSRQDLLHSFRSANPGLYVCAGCDEAGIGTRHGHHIYADVDHYFPKSIYPHLSIHPLNLVPICHSCNSSIKAAKDPLIEAVGNRLTPELAAFPFDQIDLARESYLAVDLSAWRASGRAFEIRPRPGSIGLEARVNALSHVLRIPGRWNAPDTIDEIGEALFRRLHQFFRVYISGLGDPFDERGVIERLDEFIGVISAENLGRDPYAYVMKWLLAHLVEELERGGSVADALRDELKAWSDRPRVAESRVQLGNKLREILRQGASGRS